MPRTRNVLLFLLAAIAASYAGPWVRPPGGSPAIARQAEARLQAKALVFDWADTPFADACGEVARRFGVPVRVEADAVRAAGADPDTTRVTLRAHNANGLEVLDLLMNTLRRAGGLTVRGVIDDDGGTFLVTTDFALRRRAVADRYDCAAFLGGFPEGPLVPDVDEYLRPQPRYRQTYREDLLNLVKETVDPSSWRDTGGQIGQLGFVGDRMWVVHEPERHREIGPLMGQLGEQLNTPAPETIADRLTHPSGRGWQWERR